MSKIQRGFAADIATLAWSIRCGEATTQHDHTLILIADWLLYWSRPCTWRRAWPHLRAWVRVRLWFTFQAWRLKRPRYPFDDPKLNRRAR